MKHSLANGSGYLVIDHSESPGLRPQDIPEKLKATTLLGGKGEVAERDIQHCTHCQRSIILEPMRVRTRGYCSYCHHYICDSCRKMLDITGRCIPFLRVLDEAVNAIEKRVILTD